MISATTSVILLQNGVGAEDPLHQSFPPNTIISAVVWTGGRTLPESNRKAGVKQFNREGLTIGVDYAEGRDDEGKKLDDERLEKVVEWFKAGKGSPTITKDIQSERWVKVIW